MSYALLKAAKALLDQEEKQVTAFLVERTEDPLDQIRVNQGVIAGLRRAADLIDDAWKDLGNI